MFLLDPTQIKTTQVIAGVSYFILNLRLNRERFEVIFWEINLALFSAFHRCWWVPAAGCVWGRPLHQYRGGLPVQVLWQRVPHDPRRTLRGWVCCEAGRLRHCWVLSQPDCAAQGWAEASGISLCQSVHATSSSQRLPPSGFTASLPHFRGSVWIIFYLYALSYPLQYLPSLVFQVRSR